MGSVLTTIVLPVALGIIMLGLGLSLTLGDFSRVAKHPRAVIIALLVQLILLPAICFGLVFAFQLPLFLAIGMILLAASPGGTTANLYSHLFGGDVALNISLTAINSVVAVFTLPLLTNLAFDVFSTEEQSLTIQFSKTVEVFALVLLPVALGMLVRWWKPEFATRMDRPVRITSIVILAVVILGSVISNREVLLANFAQLALITTLFCLVSLTIGYFMPGGGQLGIDFVEALKVFAIVLLPVALGMLVRRWRPSFADRMDKPVRIASIIILAVVIGVRSSPTSARCSRTSSHSPASSCCSAS